MSDFFFKASPALKQALELHPSSVRVAEGIGGTHVPESHRALAAFQATTFAYAALAASKPLPAPIIAAAASPSCARSNALS